MKKDAPEDGLEDGQAKRRTQALQLIFLTLGPHSTKVEQVFSQCWALRGHSDLDIRITALRSMGLLFAAYPQLLARALIYLDNCLHPSSHSRLRKQALGTLSDFLEDEQAFTILLFIPLNLAKNECCAWISGWWAC